MARPPRRQRHALDVLTLGVLGLFVLIVLGLIVADLASPYFHWDVLTGLFRLRADRPALAWHEYFHYETFLGQFDKPHAIAAMVLSLCTSVVTLVLVVLFAVPIGYSLSRHRFFGRPVFDAVVDLPIVMPPLAIGVTLLVFFASGIGRVLGKGMAAAGLDRNAGAGIVICQFLLSVPFAIRAAKSAFEGVDRRLEDLALTLGCTRWRAFRTVALPLARNGIIAGCIMAWARAVGLYGPLMVFVGCVRRKSEVLPTLIYLEVSTGGIEVALAATMVMIATAGLALVGIHALSGRRERWFGP